MAIRDTRSFETQLIDAVRSVDRALGGSPSYNRYQSDIQQYETQLVDAVRGIGRTLSGSGLTFGGGAFGDLAGLQEQLDSLSRRVTKLEDESFFRLVDGNITLKDGYSNLWVPGWLAAGGIGTGGSGGASNLKDLADVYHSSTSILRANGDPVDDGDVLVYDETNARWVASAGGGGGGTGTVTAVKVGSTSYSPNASGVVSLPAYPTTLPASDVYAWAKASTKPSYAFSEITSKPTTLSGYGITDAKIENGTITLGSNTITPVVTETDPTVPAWAKTQSPEIYTLGTLVTTTAHQGVMLGVTALSNALSSTAGSDASRIEWNPDADGNGHGAWHFYGNLYSDGWVAAGGIGTNSGGGGGGGLITSVKGVADLGTAISTESFSETFSAKATETIYESLVTLQGSLSNYALKTGGNDYNFHVDSLIVASGGTLDGTTYNRKPVLRFVYSYEDITSFPPRTVTETQYLAYKSDIPTSLKCPNKLTFGTKNYDGSVARTLVASDIDAVTLSQPETITGAKTFTSVITASAGLSAGGNVLPSASGINLGANTSAGRWANIYGVNEALTGTLSFPEDGTIRLGPVTISYDQDHSALHVSGVDPMNDKTIGFYCDGWVSAGGIQSNS